MQTCKDLPMPLRICLSSQKAKVSQGLISALVNQSPAAETGEGFALHVAKEANVCHPLTFYHLSLFQKKF